MQFSDFLACLQPGDVVVTRNSDEVGNPTPGYWNHGSLYVGDGIVEARSSKGGVVKSDLREFFDRYSQILALRWNHESLYAGKGIVEWRGITKEQQAALVEAGNKLVGQPYWYLSSITQWLWSLLGKTGENCVSVPRRAYLEVFGVDPDWHIPDDIVGDSAFTLVAEKK
jgi:hypothetical protein